jgi:hypothetical protein
MFPRIREALRILIGLGFIAAIVAQPIKGCVGHISASLQETDKLP